MIPAQKNMRSTAGFTLVELAIVMIIIGLLIAGVLKGQALIGNAKVTAQVAQVKGIDAATSTFKDMYNALPGDITNPSVRIPNCAALPCSFVCNGDGSIGVAAANFTAAPAGETLAYFPQLSAADLLTGINPLLLLTWGGDFPAAKINGGLHVGTLAGGAVPASGLGIPAASVIGGIYLALHNTPGGGVSAAAGTITANEAARLDTKIDDGFPTAGNVFPAGLGTCIAAGIYNENVQSENCNLYIRIQG
jgi:prepilin-type N-terminal cleavage/methylation domain-containing protein